LEDVNKPEMEAWMFDEIHGLVEDGIESFNFDSPDNYEFDFGMEYDGKVYIDSISMQSTYEITNSIMAKIDKRFNVLPKSTEANTVTEAQKVI
jgi:hypothetical protein